MNIPEQRSSEENEPNTNENNNESKVANSMNSIESAARKSVNGEQSTITSQIIRYQELTSRLAELISGLDDKTNPIQIYSDSPEAVSPTAETPGFSNIGLQIWEVNERLDIQVSRMISLLYRLDL